MFKILFITTLILSITISNCNPFQTRNADCHHEETKVRIIEKHYYDFDHEIKKSTRFRLIERYNREDQLTSRSLYDAANKINKAVFIDGPAFIKEGEDYEAVIYCETSTEIKPEVWIGRLNNAGDIDSSSSIKLDVEDGLSFLYFSSEGFKAPSIQVYEGIVYYKNEMGKIVREEPYKEEFRIFKLNNFSEVQDSGMSR